MDLHTLPQTSTQRLSTMYYIQRSSEAVDRYMLLLVLHYHPRSKMYMHFILGNGAKKIPGINQIFAPTTINKEYTQDWSRDAFGSSVWI